MIDTHSHLLPWIDHGCPDLKTSVLMARETSASGVHTVVCTPHLPHWREPDIQRAREVIDEVRAALVDAGIALTLMLGFEVDLGLAASLDSPALRTLAIEGSNGAILLEVPYAGWPVFVEETIFRLRCEGFVPVLAHPERNDRIQNSPELLSRCLKAGAVAQATAASLGGEFGRASERTLFNLLSDGLIGLLASDAHAHRRAAGWTLAPLVAALDGRLSPDEFRTLTEVNPGLLLAGKRPPPVAPAAHTSSWRERVRRKKRR